MMVRIDEHGHRMPGHRPVFFQLPSTVVDLTKAVKEFAEADGYWRVYSLSRLGTFNRITTPTVTRIPTNYNAPDHD
jgi:hypothetical protein